MQNHNVARPNWLVPFLAITVALMALSIFAAMTFNGRAQAAVNSENDGMMTGDTSVLTSNATDWQNIAGLSGSMHKAAWKDFVVDVSLECSLYTDGRGCDYVHDRHAQPHSQIGQQAAYRVARTLRRLTAPQPTRARH